MDLETQLICETQLIYDSIPMNQFWFSISSTPGIKFYSVLLKSSIDFVSMLFPIFYCVFPLVKQPNIKSVKNKKIETRSSSNSPHTPKTFSWAGYVLLIPLAPMPIK
jgi:hypothetical protein